MNFYFDIWRSSSIKGRIHLKLNKLSFDTLEFQIWIRWDYLLLSKSQLAQQVCGWQVKLENEPTLSIKWVLRIKWVLLGIE